MKLNLISAVCGLAVATAAFSACDETSTIGASLAGDTVSIVIDSAFTVTGHTVLTGPVVPKTTDMLLGAITVPEFGSVRSNVVTQFLPSISLDTTTFETKDLDEVFLFMQYNRGAFIGDSVAPQTISVYELNKQLPENITSDFNPEGYYSGKPLGTAVYNTAIFEDDSLSRHSVREVDVPLPLEFGKRICTAFDNNPGFFADGATFAKNVLPGMYIENSFGTGRMTLFARTGIKMHFTKEYYDEEAERDTTYAYTYTYMLVTPEVISNNDLDVKLSDDLKTRYAEGKQLLVAPTGYEVEMKFPGKEIVAAYRAEKNSLTVMNALSMNIPVDSIENSSRVTPPPYVLMVLKKDRDSFFAENKLPDNKTSFYASYSSTTQSYYFSSMLPYINELLEKESITDEDCTFSLVPVQISEEKLASSDYYGTPQYVVSDVQPYIVAPAMCELKLKDTKIKFTYSRQKSF